MVRVGNKTNHFPKLTANSKFSAAFNLRHSQNAAPKLIMAKHPFMITLRISFRL